MSRNRVVRLLAFVALLAALSVASFAGVFVSITVAPPPLPVYVQPACPGPDYMWTPGYWAWGDDGYYWVPGTWVMAPEPGLLWTPGYWGWSGGAYMWHGGYWGPHVGFYGGVNYGFGYGGVGFFGGEWRHGSFFYNSAVMNVRGPHITNVYVNRTVIVNERNVNRVSYNGPGGIRREPGRSEMMAERERHINATEHQMQHENTAAHNPQMFVRNNAGRPAVAATARPGEFSRDAVPARAAGGRVPPASMNANSRSMPAARNTAPPAARNNAPANNMNRSGSVQPQPSRPAINNTPQRGYSQPNSNAARPQQPQPMQRQAPQQQQRTSPQMQQRSTPQQRSAPAPQTQRPAPQAQRPAPQAQRPAPQAQPHSQPAPQQNRGAQEHEEHRH